jgi:hypothetical protein
MKNTSEGLSLTTMLSLVAFKYGELSNEEIVEKVKENFGVSITNQDILNQYVSIKELEYENNKIEYYDTRCYYDR